MLEHCSHIRIDAKRQGLNALDEARKRLDTSDGASENTNRIGNHDNRKRAEISAEVPTVVRFQDDTSQSPIAPVPDRCWRGFLEEAAATEGGYVAPRKKNVLDAFVTKPMIRGAAGSARRDPR
jgi:hypothetical protein